MYKIILIAISLLFITSCGQSQSDIDAAKEKMRSIDVAEEIKTETSTGATTETPAQEISNEEESSSNSVQIIPQTAEQFLEFSPVDESKLATWEVEISGTTTKKVDKIQVLFSNRGSDFPNDDYVLQTFTPWDKEFRYVASSRNKVLDFGENTYTFRAFSGKEITETRLRVRVTDEIVEESWVETQLIGSEDDTVLIDLPTSTAYGEPVKLWEKNFTYSQIKGLEIGKEIFNKPSCGELTEFLQWRISTWFFWNTCRDLVAGKWIFYNVIRLDGDEYVYERHYVDFEHGFYGTYELERGEWVTKDTIAEKNTELKAESYESTKVVDGLLRDIIGS